MAENNAYVDYDASKHQVSAKCSFCARNSTSKICSMFKGENWYICCDIENKDRLYGICLSCLAESRID